MPVQACSECRLPVHLSCYTLDTITAAGTSNFNVNSGDAAVTVPWLCRPCEEERKAAMPPSAVESTAPPGGGGAAVDDVAITSADESEEGVVETPTPQLLELRQIPDFSVISSFLQLLSTADGK